MASIFFNVYIKPAWSCVCGAPGNLSNRCELCGRDEEGYDKEGYDITGYNREGFDPSGNEMPMRQRLALARCVVVVVVVVVWFVSLLLFRFFNGKKKTNERTNERTLHVK
jgi:hypothetical protein